MHRLLQKLRGKKKQSKGEAWAKKNGFIIPGVNSPIPASTKDDYVIGKYRELDLGPNAGPLQKLAEHQHRIEQLQFKMQAEMVKAELKVKAEEAQAYKNVMGYPALGSTITDLLGNDYQVDGHQDVNLLCPRIELKIQRLDYGLGDPLMNVAHVVLYWVESKPKMGGVYGDPDLWPDPNQPVLYCYVDDEAQVYVGTPEHASVFSSSRPLGSKNSTLWRKVQSWQNEGSNVYALLEYEKTMGGEDRRRGYSIPAELTGGEKEKFDVFIGTLKLRAEIIEEVKSGENLK